MVKVITYGTFDLLHRGHVRLLERAKALGDYLVVGVTAADFDKRRGKINVQQSLAERMDAVRALNIADEIIVEEYEGQKIDDIRRKDISIFTVGSDWEGHFDYLNKYCKVIYLPRTEGISSSEIREERQKLRLGLVGDSRFLNKVGRECSFVNGMELTAVCTNDIGWMSQELRALPLITRNYELLLNNVDAVYLQSPPKEHYEQIKMALAAHKHVLYASPMTLEEDSARELIELSHKEGCILQEAIKTAYGTAFSRLLLMLKSGKIGEVMSVDATCTKLDEVPTSYDWTSLSSWGPTALLPIFKILGTGYVDMRAATSMQNGQDVFTKLDFLYPDAVASIKVGSKVKSEGELVISGTKGYVYVPAPWWKTDYFELRFEDLKRNERYFYQLEGEGIRYELVDFIRSIQSGRRSEYI